MNERERGGDAGDADEPQAEPSDEKGAGGDMPREIGGPSGPEPTRYGDWERNGRCYDF